MTRPDRCWPKRSLGSVGGGRCHSSVEVGCRAHMVTRNRVAAGGYFHGAAQQHAHLVHFCATLFGRHRGPSPGRAWRVTLTWGGKRRTGADLQGRRRGEILILIYLEQ